MKSPLMGRIVGFRGGGHREVAELLPWHATGALEPEERERVEAHLSVCADCREELAFQEQLRDMVADTPLDVEHGWARMRHRIDREASRRPRFQPQAWARRAFGGAILAPSGSGGGAVSAWAGWAAAASLLVTAGVVWVSPSLWPAQYHTLSAKVAPTSGNIVVIFKPDTPEHALRDALSASHARVVDGPTQAGGYVLAAPAAERPRALAVLRGRTEVALAQPIDPDPSP